MKYFKICMATDKMHNEKTCFTLYVWASDKLNAEHKAKIWSGGLRILSCAEA